MEELDWKTKLLIVSIFVVVVLLIKKIFFNGERNKKVEINRLMIDGVRYDKNREYQTAIYFFKKVLSLTDDPEILKDAYFAIAGCYFSIKKYEECIRYCNMSLEKNLSENLLALNMKYQSLYNLGRKREYLQDLVLYHSFNPRNENEKKIKDMSKSICIERTEEYCRDNVLPPSNIRYSDFFDTLLGILPVEEDDEVVYMIRHRQYDKLDETFFRLDKSILKNIELLKNGPNKLYSHKLINACLYYLKGNYEKAKELLKSNFSEFDLLFFEYLAVLTKEKSSKEVNLSNSIIQSSNPSFIFYISEIYFLDMDFDNYLANILKILDYPFAYSDILSFFGDRRDDTKFKDFAAEGIKKFGSNIRMLNVCAKYYLDKKEYDVLNEILSLMPEDCARKHIIKGLMNNYNYEESLKHFLKAKDLDSTCHEAYICISKSLKLKNEDDCKFILNESLRIASSYDEVFTSFKELIDFENQIYIRKCVSSS